MKYPGKPASNISFKLITGNKYWNDFYSGFHPLISWYNVERPLASRMTRPVGVAVLDSVRRRVVGHLRDEHLGTK